MPRLGRIITYTAMGCSLLLTTGCTDWDLKALKRAELPQDAFANALASYYLRFSESEADQYDWIDSQYFAQKGLKVVYGNPVEPEDPAKWNIHGPELDELKTAREALMQKMVAGASAEKPTVAAGALFGYDCWVEQAEEGWQAEDIHKCKELYTQSMAELNKPKEITVNQESTVMTEVPEPSFMTNSYMVFFDFDKSSLTDQGKIVLTKVAEDLKKSGENYDLILSGYTDRAGSESYNLELSKKRVETVKKLLVKMGLKEKNISTFPFGEKSPIVQTADGKKEARNRRVEIVVAQ
ncbi:OmpA family protein [bacterium]|nr:OmpA family protein [bacterium]